MAAALFVVGIGAAAPANAVASVTIDSSYVASPSTVTDTSVTFTNNASGPVYIGSPFATGGTNCTTASGSENCVVAGGGGTATFDITSGALSGFYTVAYNSSGPIGSGGPSDGGTLNLYVTYSSGGGGGGGGSSTSSSSTSQPLDLSIIPTDGTSCSNTSPSGTSGTWINLPGASDCTTPPTKSGATLLGWATTPNFPVDIAQRQVDNDWGAYETFNADGQLTGVFIPAGGATFLSAAGKLYPIWSE